MKENELHGMKQEVIKIKLTEPWTKVNGKKPSTSYYKGNSLIAEFMRNKSIKGKFPKDYINEILEDDLHPDYMVCKYNTSWDWLMPIIEMIIDDHSSECQFTGDYFLSKGYTFSMLSDEKKSYQANSEKSILDAAWKAVLEYVIYNTKD